MRQIKSYKTKQKAEILAYMRKNLGSHLTAAQIAAHLREGGSGVGLTTVYRQLEQLVQAGEVQKYQLEGQNAACFEYIGAEESGDSHGFHFKCDVCGELIHFQCKELQHAHQHMLADHGFSIDEVRTVFYGRCDRCSGR